MHPPLASSAGRPDAAALVPPDAAQPLLSVQHVTLRFQQDRRTLVAASRVSFSLHQSDRLILLGPSGCGKSSLLKAVGGFLKPAEGCIQLRGQTITGPGPDRVFVFQEFEQLLPWRTVKQNVVFALTASGKLKAPEAADHAMHFLRKVNLEPFADAYPHTLSGGMKQRVAIARCLAMNPEIILMDEPFAALDALTRRKMQEELLQLWDETHFTLLFVTHSIREAIGLGTRIVLLSPHPGRVRAVLPIAEGLSRDERAPEFTELHEHIQRTLFDGQADYVI